MTKLSMMFAGLALVTSLAACGKKKEGDTGGGGGGDKAPAIAINEADWVAKDLHAVAPMINVTMKVPKDAKMEKNGNGGVDIHVNDYYLLTVSGLAVSSIAEAKKSDAGITVDDKSYINGKTLTDEPNGFVYTHQMKDEENGTKYQPEAHFVYYLEKDGAIYSIQDARPLDHFNAPGSTYSPEVATKVYNIVKGSAKVN